MKKEKRQWSYSLGILFAWSWLVASVGILFAWSWLVTSVGILSAWSWLVTSVAHDRIGWDGGVTFQFGGGIWEMCWPHYVNDVCNRHLHLQCPLWKVTIYILIDINAMYFVCLCVDIQKLNAYISTMLRTEWAYFSRTFLWTRAAWACVAGTLAHWLSKTVNICGWKMTFCNLNTRSL